MCSTGLIGVRLPMERSDRGVGAAVAAPGRRRRRRCRARDPDDRHRPEDGDRRRGAGGHGRRHGQGCRDAGAGAGHDARRDHHRCRGGAGDAGRRTAVRRRRRTFDRLDSDGCMSTNDTVLAMASGASGTLVGRDLDEADVHRAADRCVSRPRAAAPRRRGGSHQADRDPGARCGVSSDDAVDGGAVGGAQQPVQVRGPWRGPELGPGAGSGGNHRRGRSTAQVDLAVAINGVTGGARRCGGVRAAAAASTCPTRWVTVEIDLGAGTAAGHVWTNDLTAAYVHENSAYSS